MAAEMAFKMAKFRPIFAPLLSPPHVPWPIFRVPTTNAEEFLSLEGGF
jgi:hypothetical protein